MGSGREYSPSLREGQVFIFVLGAELQEIVDYRVGASKYASPVPGEFHYGFLCVWQK